MLAASVFGRRAQLSRELLFRLDYFKKISWDKWRDIAVLFQYRQSYDVIAEIIRPDTSHEHLRKLR